MTQHLPLDPKDWDQFRASAHALLDACIDRLSQAADHPWQPVPEAVQNAYQLDTHEGGEAAIAQVLASQVLPYNTGSTHPGFFGWVHGTGLADGILSEMVAATMNSNCGGRDHGAVYMERSVVDWTRRIMGFPETASGLLVTGTSQATVLALSCARIKALGKEVRAHGNRDAKLRVYAAAGTHNAIKKAVELLGLGHDNLVMVPQRSIGGAGLDIEALEALVADDRAQGYKPMAVVGTAGSVDFGLYDDLHALVDFAQAQDLWLHIDAAFGAWIKLADQPYQALADGLERAHSMACDFHKWMSVPYDCGIVLIHDEAIHRAAFAARPNYLEAQEAGIGAGDPWYCDYGIDLSRGNKALKVWTAIKSKGTAAFGQSITANCQQAALMGQLVEEADKMALLAPVVSNLCVFTADASLPADQQSVLNKAIAVKLQLSGEAVFSTTKAGGMTCLRAAIVNHRTNDDTIRSVIEAVANARDEV